MTDRTKRTRYILAAACAALVLSALALHMDEPDPANAGMGWSALTGVLDTAEPAENLIVTFKVINRQSGDVVWQPSAAAVTLTKSDGQLTYHTVVDPSVRPDHPDYQWVMWVYARRAEHSVWIGDFRLNDSLNTDYHGTVPAYDVQGRMLEVPLALTTSAE